MYCNIDINTECGKILRQYQYPFKILKYFSVSISIFFSKTHFNTIFIKQELNKLVCFLYIYYKRWKVWKIFCEIGDVYELKCDINIFLNPFCSKWTNDAQGCSEDDNYYYFRPCLDSNNGLSQTFCSK